MSSNNNITLYSSSKKCPTQCQNVNTLSTFTDKSLSTFARWTTVVEDLEYEEKLFSEAKVRIEERIQEHQFNVSPKLEAFLNANPLLMEVMVMNGVSKSEFAKRFISGRSYYRSHSQPSFDIYKYLSLITEIFFKVPNSKKKEIMDELSFIFMSPALPKFLQTNWQSCCGAVTEILNEAFRSSNPVLVEQAAIISANIAWTFPPDIYRNSTVGAGVLKELLLAFNRCHAEAMKYTTELSEARHRHLDEEIRGEATRKFTFRRYRTTGIAKHRLGSILYYSAAVILGRMGCLAHSLYRIGGIAMRSANPVQYFWLNLLVQTLRYLTQEEISIHAVSRVYGKKLRTLLTSCVSGDRPGIQDNICAEIAKKCLYLTRNKLQGSVPVSLLPVKITALKYDTTSSTVETESPPDHEKMSDPRKCKSFMTSSSCKT